MKPNSISIKFQISILYTLILGLILVVFSGVLFLISNAFLHQIDQQLKVEAQAVDLTIRSYVGVLGDNHSALVQAVDKTMAMKNETIFQYKTLKISQKWSSQAQSMNLNKDYINFVSEDGTEIISSPNLENKLRLFFMEDFPYAQGEQIEFRTINLKHKNIRLIDYPFTEKAFGRYVIQVGEAQEPIIQQLHKWLYSIAISVPLVLILTSFVGRLLANRILRPVYEITSMANRITQQDLSTRIKNKNFGAEMEELIDSFNRMIARLEKSFKYVEQFSYHVAHELKTPLTIIQGETELLLRKERSADEYQQALRIVVEESKRVRQTIDDLLLLTKLGYLPEALKIERFDYIEFFGEVGEQSRFLAANKGIIVNIDLGDLKSPLMIKGDRLHLRRLFFNIIDNAIKYTLEGGSIFMRIDCGQGKVVTSITDTGAGIAEENLNKIFEEFFRADSDCTGSGLGLNIANTIAKLHEGEIQVESRIRFGSTFRIILPL